MNRRKRTELSKIKRKAKQRLEQDDPNFAFQTLLRTGNKLDPFVIAGMFQQMPLRDVENLSFRLAQALSPPANRHARRTREAREKKTVRALERAVDRSLDLYEAREKMLPKEFKETYKKMCAHMKPHPDGRFCGHALDTAEIKQLRKALYEIHVMDILFTKIAKRARQMVRA